MRLIDANKLKEAIEKEKDDNDYMCRLCLEATKEIIDEQPTAYDVDKVVESLMNRFRIVSNDEDLEWNRAIDYAIGIVKEEAELNE